MVRFNIRDLFEGDKVLNELGDTIINQNFHEFIKDVEPKVQLSLGKI